MEFKGLVPYGTRERQVPHIEISDEEILRARIGFESIGSDEQSTSLAADTNLDSRKKARQVIAGNLALIKSLSYSYNSETFKEIRRDAEKTIDSGFDALDEAEDAFNEANP